MKAQELMLGDLVRLVSINKKNTYKPSIIQVSPFVLNELLKGNIIIEPIPLTEQMLLDNGFTIDDLDCIHYTSGDKWYCFPNQYQELNRRGFRIEARDGKYRITDHQLMVIEYVHQLHQCLRQCTAEPSLIELADNFKVIVDYGN